MHRAVFAAALFSLLLCTQTLIAQYTESQLDSLRTTFPEQEVVLYTSSANYTVSLGRKNEPLNVRVQQIDKYVAIKDNAAALHRTYYNDYVDLLTHGVKGNVKFNKYTSQRCGPIEQDDAFYNDTRVCDFYLNFDESGDHLSVSTSKLYLDQKYLTKIPLTNPYGAKKKILRFEVPEEVNFELQEMNFEGYQISRTDSRNAKKSLRIIEYQIENLPAYINLENLPEFNCAFPYLLVFFNSYTSNGDTISLIENTDDLYAWYKTLVTEVDISTELQGIARDLCADSLTDEECIANIFSFVQDKIRYLSFHEGHAAFVPELPNEVYQKKYGDCKGMANLCKGMLKYMGYDARLCWIYSGYSCQPDNIPSIASANHLICATVLGDSILYLDPTSKYSSLQEINYGIQGKECIIEDGDNYLIGYLPATSYSENLSQYSDSITISGKRMHIQGEHILGGVLKSGFQELTSELGGSNLERLNEYYITGGDNNISIIDYDAEGIQEKVEQIRYTYELESPEGIINLGNELLITLDRNQELKGVKVDTNRQYPYSFDAPVKYSQHSILEIPESYDISKLPKPLSYSHDCFDFFAGFQQEGSYLIYSKNLDIKVPVLSPDDFEAWNEAVGKLEKFYKDVIILKKAAK